MKPWLIAAGFAGVAVLPGTIATAHAEPTESTAEWSPEDAQRLAPHHVRSFLEMGAGLGLGLGGYWVFKDGNVTDWDNPKLSQRFSGAAWTLDNNDLAVNFLGHGLSGSLSYNFARANHQSVAGAFGYSFLTSFVWEFVIEFKEKISINDVMVTPGVGLPVGEFFHKLGLHLDTGSQGSTAVQVSRVLLGAGVALDRKLDGRPPPHVLTRDNLGFSAAMWHEFSARYGVSAISTPGEATVARGTIGAAGRLVTLAGYGQAQSFGRAFYGAEISDFSVASEASRYGAGLLLDADTILAGYHAQAIERVGHVRRGAWVTVGASMGYQYLLSSANRYATVERAVALPDLDLAGTTPTDREQFSALDLPGLAVDVRSLGAWGYFDLSSRLEPSFGGLGAAAFYDWAAAHPQERTKHILQQQGYFYGWGGSLKLRARLALGPVRSGFELNYSRYESMDGHDRDQAELTIDEHAAGDVLRYRASVGIAPAGSPVSIELDMGERRFRSRVGSFERNARAIERGLSATWEF